MQVFLTGAGGYIGFILLEKLLAGGHTVHVLHRNPDSDVFGNLTGYSERLRIFTGSLDDKSLLALAMAGCEQVYHLAAYARVWAKDPQTYFKVNCWGTENILSTCLEQGVASVLYCSSAGAFGPSGQVPLRECDPRMADFFTPYESSKFVSEELCLRYVQKGLNVKIANPSRVYGPGLLGESNAFTRIMSLYIQSKWNIVPGSGKTLGNYVFVDDVAQGLIGVMDAGRLGEKYLLGGDNLSYLEFFSILSEVSGVNRPLLHLPFWQIKILAKLAVARARITGSMPAITPQWASKYAFDWAVDSHKAIAETRFNPRSFKAGASQTIDWLRKGKV